MNKRQKSNLVVGVLQAGLSWSAGGSLAVKAGRVSKRGLLSLGLFHLHTYLHILAWLKLGLTQLWSSALDLHFHFTNPICSKVSTFATIKQA